MDENPDVNTEITLDDFNADEQQPAKAAPSPAAKDEKVEKPAPEEKAVKEAEEPKESDGDDTPALPDVPTKDEGETPEETEDKPSKADERKSQLNTEIRDLVAKRNALKESVEKANSEVYQVATEDELVDGGMTAIEAKVEAMRQEREMEKYNTQVAEAQLTLGHEANRVIQDFPIFNPEAKEYDKDLHEQAAELLEAALIIDPNSNQIIGSNVSPYKLYQTLAQAAGISAVKGQLKGQADTEAMLANADSASTSSPPKVTEDPLIKLWRED
jgi:phosphopantetheinyl transferase (holo-ACP synthase)